MTRQAELTTVLYFMLMYSLYCSADDMFIVFYTGTGL